MVGHDPVKAAIISEAKALGFDDIGFLSAALSQEDAQSISQDLQSFVDDGRHGTMDWMETRLHQRSHPQALWPDARSVIALGVNYGPNHDPRETLHEKQIGNISVYARGKDYHDIIKKKLKALGRWMAQNYRCELKVFVDTAPVPEKPLAQLAGLGWQGKHTNVVSNKFGSWLFLGAIYTTLDLEPDQPHRNQCGSCNACMTACPTNAFPEPYKLDARRCISYLTIEFKGLIPEEFRPLMGNRIYGCDDCLAACPWNKFAKISSESQFYARAELGSPPLRDLVKLDDAAFREVFSGSPIKRIGRDRFVRNVLIAIGNSGDRSLLQDIKPLLKDTNDVIRETAKWADMKLASS
ncbi:tRNA epoxyqueuosine(34) reductase QueG [Kordiimonas sp. SCSIO 12610]|uniref:tRNA epoxyqueuosine(34) reductase QueG n=1 Tax=Kordiimonas sp. SCSIO 12610 TaxID=2829597 RepID=UPI00210A91FF|nr:tRNA epoxyqueuosine(34) reductase QueG [Kordiimonas sp. SCSIO 12610]UTW55411.1 tRNA epoxyqueuosine(34) reductase QueG [Kordiimonas sp. SCSIO 12610]